MSTVPIVERTSAEERRYQKWIMQWWRPTMAYVYMFICLFDFFLAPIGWSIAQAWQGQKLTVQYMPMTLQGAGLFHIAMGAILGVAAWGRSQEKMAMLGNQQSMMAYNQGMGGYPQQGGMYGGQMGGGMYGGQMGGYPQQGGMYPRQPMPVRQTPSTEPKEPPTRDRTEPGEPVYGREN